MKRFLITLVALVALSVTTVPAHAAMSGSNPRPQSSSGSGMFSAFLSYFGF
jgi:methionine-rich copper-binding protein CopC